MAASAQGVKAGKAYIELFADKSPLVRTLKSVQTDLQSFAGKVRSVGREMALAGNAIVASFVAVGKLFAGTGSELDKLSKLTGTSVSKLAGLQYAAVQAGGSAEALDAGLKGMQATLIEAVKGSDSARLAFARLGVSGAQLMGMTPDQQLKLFAGRLAGVKNPALQASLAMEVFGGSAEDLLPLLRQGSKGIDAFTKEAESLGIVMSKEDAAAATKLNQAFSRLWQTFQGIKNAVGAAVAPALTDLLNQFASGLSKVTAWVKENRGLVVSFLKIAAVVAAVGTALVGLSFATSAIAAGFGMAAKALTMVGSGLSFMLRVGGMIKSVLLMPLGAIWTAFKGLAVVVGTALKGGFMAAVSFIGSLLTPVGVLGIALVALGGYFLYASGIAGQAITSISELFGDLKKDASDAMGGIADALAAGNITLAAEILWNGLKLAWQRGIATLNKLWQGFKAFFLRTWNEASSNVAAVFTNTWAAISSGWTETVDFLADVWTLFTSTLTKTWNNSIGFIKKAWVKLKGLFDKDINVQAEVEKINQETEGKNNAVDEARDKKIGDREAERKKRLQAIEDARKGAIAESEAMRQQENDRIEKQANDSIAATQKNLDEAKDKFHKSIEQAKTEKEKAKKPGPAVKDAAKSNPFMFEQKQTVVGSFSSFGLRGLGASSTQDRIAKATEATAKNTSKIAKPTDPSFGPY